MQEEYHIKIKKEYAVELIEDLLKDEAIEEIETVIPKLQDWQKKALDEELRLFAEDPGYGLDWNEVKTRF